MNLFTARLFPLAIAVAIAASVLVTGASASGPRVPTHTTTGALVLLRKTALGTILVDARGRTLYLFEKDRNGISMCTAACAAYWPALTAARPPRAGNGVKQSLLRATRSGRNAGQVSYAGHPLYTFVGDKRAGQTTGEGLHNFGAGWYAISPNGVKIEQNSSAGSASSAAGGSSSGGYSSGGGY